MKLNAFDVAAILVMLAAVFGYVNYRFVRLPQSAGILLVGLVGFGIVWGLDSLFPNEQIRARLMGFLGEINFQEALMHGMLCFLLFAGGLHVDLGDLLSNKWTVGALATLGVLISTAVVGFVLYGVFALFGWAVPLIVCLIFGALISPTDPIAVLSILKDLHAPKSLDAKIAGESLFNDGVGVVVFFALLSLAGLDPAGEAHVTPDLGGLVMFFVQEVAGGVALGLGLGYVAYRALKSIDYAPLELMITLALVMFGYAMSFWVHVSGPIAVVVASLLIGNHGRQFAMSRTTVEHVDGFWKMMDDILNAVLFLLLGLEVFAVEIRGRAAWASLIAIPVVLLARWVSVAIPVTALRLRRSFDPGVIPILTWGGVRGGISVAMVLSLPKFPAKDLLLSCTYAVVVFSILVQGLTMKRLLAHYGIGKE